MIPHFASLPLAHAMLGLCSCFWCSPHVREPAAGDSRHEDIACIVQLHALRLYHMPQAAPNLWHVGVAPIRHTSHFLLTPAHSLTHSLQPPPSYLSPRHPPSHTQLHPSHTISRFPHSFPQYSLTFPWPQRGGCLLPRHLGR